MIFYLAHHLSHKFHSSKIKVGLDSGNVLEGFYSGWNTDVYSPQWQKNSNIMINWLQW